MLRKVSVDNLVTYARPLFKNLIEHGLARLLDKDSKKKRIDIDLHEDGRKCLAALLKSVHNGSLAYYDSYRKKWFDSLLVSRHCTDRPDRFSIEAFSHAVFEDGVWKYHLAVDNIGLVVRGHSITSSRNGQLDFWRSYVHTSLRSTKYGRHFRIYIYTLQAKYG